MYHLHHVFDRFMRANDKIDGRGGNNGLASQPEA
jgi:hypothetical protein